MSLALKQAPQFADRTEEVHANSSLAEAERLTDLARWLLGDLTEREHQSLTIR